MNINIDKIDKICRTCLSEKVNMRPIFEAFIADMLMACASVQIRESDDLPKLICTQCLQQVNRSYSFKQLCEKSDSSLRQYLQELQTSREEKANDTIRSNCRHLIYESTIENKESVEYRIKTEQLKLEISEHLQLNLNHPVNYEPSKINTNDDSCQSYSENVANTNEECEENEDNDGFQCNDCHETFKGIISM